MDSLSVVVTACNCGPFLGEALQSVHDALAALHADFGRSPGMRAEVVVVDDGSSDETPRVVEAFLAGREGWRSLRRSAPTSPAAARNAGAALARGDALFFLDGDDLFLPNHLAACLRVLREGGADFVKTGVRLADPVHPDWRGPILGSVVIKLAVRRACHEAVGGFPDYHLFRRDGERMAHEADVFFKVEDMFYNRLLAGLFRGRELAQETVEYVRRPGNAYDRQYEKFRRPRGSYPEAGSEDERYQLRLGEVIFQRRMEEMRRSAAAGRASPGGGVVPGAAPDDAEAQVRAAAGLAAQARHEEADAAYRRALRLRPGHPDALAQLGLLLAEQGKLDEAVAFLRQAVKARPDAAPARHNLGVALAQSGRPEEAARELEEAARLKPDYAEAYYNLGNVLQGMGKRDEAIGRYRAAVRLRPGYGEAYNNLGLALTEAGKHGEAAVYLQQAVRLRPQAAESHNNLGLAYAGLGRFDDAEACYREALRIAPGYVEAHNDLGSAYKERGRLEEALACYQVALWHDPQSPSTRYNRSLALLQKGDWREGWKEYEQRWKRKGVRERLFPRPRWDGSPLDGKTILLWCEQGLGDAIHFVRYAALVKAKGGRVALECPGFMLPLFSTCPGVDQVVAEGSEPPAFDVQAPLMSLPMVLGTTLENVPAELPYLSAEPGRVEKWKARLDAVPGFKIGVAWQGNPHFSWDHWRSFPLEALAPLAAVEGVRLVSLQKGPGAEQVRGLKGCFAVEELDGLDAEGGAFLDTAAAMKCLDLVATADTAAAHLAGALGVPAWVALSAVADWRWLVGREDTPWYPTLRLFRQATLGDWGGVMTRMAEALRALAGRPRGPLAHPANPVSVRQRLAEYP
jgi:tetratricopeptide (TPR) repeat protein